MPVITVSADLDKRDRREALAAALTDAIVEVCGVPAEKVQTFFRHAEDITAIYVLAIRIDGVSTDNLVEALRAAAAPILGFPLDPTVEWFAADYTAKSGLLRRGQ